MNLDVLGQDCGLCPEIVQLVGEVADFKWSVAREHFTHFFEVLVKINVTNKVFWFGLE